jgi:hypothetical protein
MYTAGPLSIYVHVYGLAPAQGSRLLYSAEILNQKWHSFTTAQLHCYEYYLELHNAAVDGAMLSL